MIVAPPSLVGLTGFQVRAMAPLSAVVEMRTGAVVGGEAGTTATEGVDVVPVPRPLVAETLKVYEVPLVRASTVQERFVVAVHVLPVGVLMTLYLVIAVPLAGGADQLTLTTALRRRDLQTVGAPGTLCGSTVLEGVDVGPVPAPFVARTRKLYVSPLARPDTVHERVPVAVQVLAVGELVTV